MNSSNVAFGVVVAGYALNNISGLQADLVAREESEILGSRNFHKVFLFDPELSGEGYLTCACVLILRIIPYIELFGLILRIVIDDELDGL